MLLGAVCISCSSKSFLNATNADNKLTREKNYEVIAIQDSVINYGMRYMSTPYRYGGTTPRGFDCSGFTSHVYSQFGFNLNRSSRDQAKQFPLIPKNELCTGDLVFFEGRSHNGIVGHVGIVTERKINGEFNFLHSSIKRGVTISSSEEPYYASRFLKAGRVIDSKSDNLQLTRVPDATQNNTGKVASRQLTRAKAEPEKMYDAIYHTVKKGDNLSKISKKYDVPVSTIIHLNNLQSKKLKKEQRLLISEAVDMPDVPPVRVPAIDHDKTQTSQVNNEIALIQTEELHTPETEKPERKSQVSARQVSPQIQSKSSSDMMSEQKPSQEKTVIETAELKKKEENAPVKEINHSKHQVSAGETLYSIARMYNLTVDDIKQLNHLKDNTIQSGQELVVNNTVKTRTNKTDRQEVKGKQTNHTHTVQRGETLYALSRKYNCTVNEIRKWNSHIDDNIRPGDKIKILNN